jgi:hypothetical protein
MGLGGTEKPFQKQFVCIVKPHQAMSLRSTILIASLLFAFLPGTSFSQGWQEEESNYETYYIVIADSGTEYFPLRSAMFALSQSADMDVDTLDRGWNAEKGKITLAENSDDDIWKGEYYPRRHASNFLSLEYLDWFRENSNEKTIAIVAGICESQDEAKTLKKQIKAFAPNAYFLKAKVYVGCMH